MSETAILAGGCFWGVQELLRRRDGVISTRVGYTGDNLLTSDLNSSSAPCASIRHEVIGRRSSR